MSEWYHAILYVAMIGGLAFTHRWAFDVGWPKIGVVLVLDVVVAIGFAIQFIQWLVDTVGVNLVKFFYVLSSRPGLQEGEG